MSITHVSDTAHWVAMYRALESERSDALFDDPYARRMAGKIGDSIIREMPSAQSVAWAVVARTVSMDEMILERIRNGASKVLNLGAGLDTRAFRLALPATLRWFDVDLPPMIDHRRASLKDVEPRCLHAHVGADLNDPDDLEHVLSLASAGDGPLLVVSEGLLVYLTPIQVASLAAALRAETMARWWLTDLVSPLALSMASDGVPAGLAERARYRFAPRDSSSFFAPLGWREVAYRSTMNEAARLRRASPTAQYLNSFITPWWPALRRISGCSLMEASA